MDIITLINTLVSGLLHHNAPLHLKISRKRDIINERFLWGGGTTWQFVMINCFI